MPVPVLVPSSARTLGYVRVSTEKQAGATRTSLADQEQAIRVVATRAGRTLDHVFVDPGASGATAEGRPAFMQLVAFCEAHPQSRRNPGVVIALDDSRWGRFENPEESGYWRVRLAKSGWRVGFVHGDDVADGIGRMVIRTIGAAQASEYRENLKRVVRQGRRSTVAAGYWCGPAPFGYRRKVVHPKGAERELAPGVRKGIGERVKLVPGRVEEVEALRWAFASYAAGTITLEGICRAFDTRVPRSAGWHVTTVKGMLQSRTYLGEIMTGRKSGGARPGDPRVMHDPSTWIVAPNAHEPIISVELFDRVQQRFDGRAPRVTKPKRYLLSGLMTCADCGATYKCAGVGGHKPKQYPIYRCSRSYDLRNPCSNRGTVRVDQVDRIVIDTLADVIETPAVQSAIARAYDRAMERRCRVAPNRREDLAQQLRELERRRDRLVEAVEQGLLTNAEAQTRLTAVRADLERVTSEAQQARFAVAAATPNDRQREAFVALAKSFRLMVAQAPTIELRRHIAPWIARAVFNNETKELTMVMRRVPAIMDVPGSGFDIKARPENIRQLAGRVIQFGKSELRIRRATAAELRKVVNG